MTTSHFDAFGVKVVGSRVTSFKTVPRNYSAIVQQCFVHSATASHIQPLTALSSTNVDNSRQALKMTG